jgi:hypothetical protein
MPQRRNPFPTLPATATETVPTPLPTRTIYDSLRLASQKIRDRNWERRTYDGKAVYRGVDPYLALRVKEIAGDLMVNPGEVARKLLEYGLRAYAEGELNLDPRPHPERMHWTLFPSESSATRRVARKPKKPAQPCWKVLTTWRGFPPALKQEIAALASEQALNVPVGELVSALLRFSLTAHEYGLLVLEPVQKSAGFTLADEALS